MILANLAKKRRGPHTKPDNLMVGPTNSEMESNHVGKFLTESKSQRVVMS